MADDVSTARHSDLAFVVARIAVDREPHWLLRRHAKWGDWSLVGGHVEPDEHDDWLCAARREAEEELEPLRHGIDFVVEPMGASTTSSGPVPSRSVAGRPTTYLVRWFVLSFLTDPADCLAQLSPDDFLLVPESKLLLRHDVSDVTSRLIETLHGDPASIPLAGRIPVTRAPPRLSATSGSHR
jgi:8-oxo-dGTP pyrophosphatase MutT (NUDIX family)